MSSPSPVTNSVEVGDGLMKINWDELTTNNDLKSASLSLTSIESEIASIYQR